MFGRAVVGAGWHHVPSIVCTRGNLESVRTDLEIE